MQAAFVSRLQTLGGFGGKADQLNAYNVYNGSPDGFEADLQRYLTATPRDLAGAAARWLDVDRAVALCVVPTGQPELALPDSTPASGVR